MSVMRTKAITFFPVPQHRFTNTSTGVVDLRLKEL